MLSSAELYPVVDAWLQGLAVTTQPVARAALAHLVTAVLVGQSLRASAVMRALVSDTAVSARQRYTRLARAWGRAWLSPAWLTPRLVRAALACVPVDPPGRPTAGLTHLALDRVRCGPWELFTLGVVWHGRVLPVGWAVLPYPLPKGQFTPTVCGLLRQVAAAWPTARPAHLVADRAFASRALLGTLDAVGWDFTLRLRAPTPVTVAGVTGPARDRLEDATPGAWSCHAAGYGTGARALPGWLVIGRGLALLPWHQRGPASLRARAARQAARQQHLVTKHPGRAPDRSAETDAWVILWTTHPTWLAAVASYATRWATEGSYRDAQSGWDGQHGWDLEATVRRLTDPTTVAAVVGLWALGSLLQTWLGAQVGAADAPPLIQAVRAEWTTTGRLSVWARGRLALTEPSGRLRAWLRAALTRGADRIAAAPPSPIATPTPLRRRRRRPHQEAA